MLVGQGCLEECLDKQVDLGIYSFNPWECWITYITLRIEWSFLEVKCVPSSRSLIPP